MSDFNYHEWVEGKISELLCAKVYDENGYDEQVIREYLLFAHHKREGTELLDFFKEHYKDKKLFITILAILLDESEDYSNDARISAASIIPSFDLEILQEYKKELRYAQAYEILALHPYSDEEIPKWLIE